MKDLQKQKETLEAKRERKAAKTLAVITVSQNLYDHCLCITTFCIIIIICAHSSTQRLRMYV